MKQDEMDELMEEIRPNSKDQILRRIKLGGFAKVIIWACASSRDTDFVGVGELARFMRISLQRARYILEDMVKFDLLKRNKLSGCNVEYFFVYDNYGKPKVYSYFDVARKSLGIKMRPEKVEKAKHLNTKGG